MLAAIAVRVGDAAGAAGTRGVGVADAWIHGRSRSISLMQRTLSLTQVEFAGATSHPLTFIRIPYVSRLSIRLYPVRPVIPVTWPKFSAAEFARACTQHGQWSICVLVTYLVHNKMRGLRVLQPLSNVCILSA